MAYVWVAKMTLVPQEWDENGQEIAGFFSSVSGQSGMIRISDPVRRMTIRDYAAQQITEPWSDTTLFDDGTGFASGMLPDFVQLYADASKGDSSIILKGLPSSETKVFRRGDLIELRPNGIASETPNLYEVQANASTDASGKVRINILPPLRQGFVAGDMAVLRNASSVFRLIDDEQGIASMSLPRLADIGFNLVEAII